MIVMTTRGRRRERPDGTRADTTDIERGKRNVLKWREVK